MTDDVVIVGAGPAGIAAGLALQDVGVGSVLLERDRVASRWRSAYAALHLNTHRRSTGLPGRPIPRALGAHPSAGDYAAYLEAAAGDLDIRCGVEVTRIDRGPDGLVVETSTGATHRASDVVVATGGARRPRWPEQPDLRAGPAHVIHADDYTDGSLGRDLDVVVVGGGNSASDIAVDLVDSGARSVTVSLRRPPHILPRDLGPVPMQTFLDVVGHLPDVWADRALRAARRLWLGDLAPHGLPAPMRTLVEDHAASGTTAIIDRGFARAVRRRSVRVVGEVTGADETGLRLRDGSLLQPELVVVATGYTTALPDLVGHLGVLDAAGLPAGDGHPRDVDGLWFLGFNDPVIGQIRQIRRDSVRLAQQLSGRGRPPG